MLKARPGSAMPLVFSMVGMIMAVVVAGIAWLGADVRRTQSDRWRAVAADAAQSGLALTLAWARSTIDRTRTTPSEWDRAEGVAINPLRSMFESPEFRALTPDDVGALPRLRENLGSRDVMPAEVGDVIEADGAGEYVVGRYGDHIATVRVRLQSFRLSEDAPRQYKIGVAGRVRVYDARASREGAFRGTRLVADRVLLATMGKQVLSRYAAITDIDLVHNWAPGERVEGPLHINRGYVDAPVGIRPANTTLRNGRSFMSLNAPGPFQVPPGAAPHPVFTDVVSMTLNREEGAGYQDSADFSSAVKYNDGALSAGAYSEERARAIFQAPENQAQVGGKAGPVFQADPIELPRNSRARLPAVWGLSEAEYPDRINHLDLEDGVYIPTRDLVENGATRYGGGENAPVGGIYVRGVVEVMRLATTETKSYYFFQVGYVKTNLPRRTYVVVADRRNHTLRLVAYGPNSRLEDIQNTPLAAFDAAGGIENDLAKFAVGGSGVIAQQFNAPGTGARYPFNGVIFVDYSKHDPIRAPGTPWGLVRSTAANPVRALTGHILALGDPGQRANSLVKRAFPGAWNADLPPTGAWPAAETISTEDVGGPAGALRPASRLSIITSGDVFIQNHLVLQSVARACGMRNGPDRVVRENVNARSTRDLLGIVSDKQILIGLAAPSATNREETGVLLMGAFGALGDPAYDPATNTTMPVPASNTSKEGLYFRYRGSFSTEGLMALFAPEFGEKYNILWPSGTAVPTTFDSAGDAYNTSGTQYPFNPLYLADGPYGEAFPELLTSGNGPNLKGSRGRLTVFGSLVTKKRGAVGTGNRSYDKDNRYDQRLLTIAPPLFPNAVNLVLQISTLDGLGLPPYRGPRADEVSFLNE
ncbi:MAG: hypothetical protein VKN33_05555 [Candidatus Sericytochromatia bacterium]|nr:hypothetical protein [Candidatus Sericytochromatia bacterium]